MVFNSSANHDKHLYLATLSFSLHLPVPLSLCLSLLPFCFYLRYLSKFLRSALSLLSFSSRHADQYVSIFIRLVSWFGQGSIIVMCDLKVFRQCELERDMTVLCAPNNIVLVDIFILFVVTFHLQTSPACMTLIRHTEVIQTKLRR